MGIRKIVSFVITVLCIIVSTFESYALSQPLGELSKDQIIDQFFKDRNIDSVEGVWITTDNKYEFAIVKNSSPQFREYEYLGIVTGTSESRWKIGEVKLLLKRTSSDALYTGNYYVIENSGSFWGRSNKKEYGTTFSMPSKNLLECFLPIGTYGLPVKTVFLRTYPTYDPHSTTGLQTSGTGFFVTKNLVATNYHVIADAKVIELTFGDTTIPAVIAAKDPANDLALLRVTGFESMAAPVSIAQLKEIKEGNHVFTVGFPLINEMGTRAKIGEGIINSISGIDDDFRMFQMSIPIQPGNSGSPLYNTRGEVIGIVSTTLNSKYFLNKIGVIPQNVSYAIKINYLNTLFSTLPEEDKLSNGSVGANLDATQIMEIAKQSVVFINVKK